MLTPSRLRRPGRSAANAQHTAVHPVPGTHFPVAGVGGAHADRFSLRRRRVTAVAMGECSEARFESGAAGNYFDPAAEVERLWAEAQVESNALLAEQIAHQDEIDAFLREAEAEHDRLQRAICLEAPELARAGRDAEADLLEAVGNMDDCGDVQDAPYDLEILALREGEPMAGNVRLGGPIDF